MIVKLLQVFDQFDVTMVAATHNDNNKGKRYEQKVNGWPSRYANPATQERNSAGELERLDNLIVVSGTDINSFVSPLNPYFSWIAMAPGFRVHTQRPVGNGLILNDGASLGQYSHSQSFDISFVHRHTYVIGQELTVCFDSRPAHYRRDCLLAKPASCRLLEQRARKAREREEARHVHAPLAAVPQYPYPRLSQRESRPL